MQLLFVFLVGIAVLVGAVALNLLASSLGLMNWYEYLKEPHRAGVSSYAWLFVIYPFGLGLCAHYAAKMLGLW